MVTMQQALVSLIVLVATSWFWQRATWKSETCFLQQASKDDLVISKHSMVMFISSYNEITSLGRMLAPAPRPLVGVQAHSGAWAVTACGEAWEEVAISLEESSPWDLGAQGHGCQPPWDGNPWTLAGSVQDCRRQELPDFGGHASVTVCLYMTFQMGVRRGGWHWGSVWVWGPLDMVPHSDFNKGRFLGEIFRCGGATGCQHW